MGLERYARQRATPLKFNMEPENQPLEKVGFLLEAKPSFSDSMLNFEGVSTSSDSQWLWKGIFILNLGQSLDQGCLLKRGGALYQDQNRSAPTGILLTRTFKWYKHMRKN